MEIRNNLDQQLQKYSDNRENQPTVIKKRKFTPVPLQNSMSQTKVLQESPKKPKAEPEIILIPSETVFNW